MKEKNKIGSLATTLGITFIMNLALVMVSHATENPFDTTSLSSSYIVADGHKHTEQDTDTEQDTGTEQDTDTDTEQDKQKKSECNPDKGQNCNEPSW